MHTPWLFQFTNSWQHRANSDPAPEGIAPILNHPKAGGVLALPARMKASSRKERLGQHFPAVAHAQELRGAASMNPNKAAAQAHTMCRQPRGLLSCSHVVAGWEERIPLSPPSPEGGQGFCLCVGEVEKGGMSGSSVGFPSEQSIHLQRNQAGQSPRSAVFTLAKLLAANCGSSA